MAGHLFDCITHPLTVSCLLKLHVRIIPRCEEFHGPSWLIYWELTLREPSALSPSRDHHSIVNPLAVYNISKSTGIKARAVVYVANLCVWISFLVLFSIFLCPNVVNCNWIDYCDTYTTSQRNICCFAHVVDMPTYIYCISILHSWLPLPQHMPVQYNYSFTNIIFTDYPISDICMVISIWFTDSQHCREQLVIQGDHLSYSSVNAPAEA